MNRNLFASFAFFCGYSLSCAIAADAAAQEPIRIITLGDSITKAVRPGVTAEQSFAVIVQKQLRAQGLNVEVQNVGIGGERTDQALLRLDKAIISQKPHLVTIMYGTNDGWVDKGKTESRLPLDKYEANLRELVARMKAAGIQPVLMTEPMFGEKNQKNGVGEDGNVRLAQYVDLCRKVARETQTPLVDHFGHWGFMAKRKQILQDWTTDGCHPNPVGQEVLAQRITQVLLPLAQRLADKTNAWQKDLPYRVQLDELTSGYDEKMCWVHPRAGIIPGNPNAVVFTMQRLLLTGSDVFYALNDMRSDDLGKTWTAPKEHTTELGRRNEDNGIVVVPCDFWPKWHAKSGKLLGIGHNARYQDNKVMHQRKRETCFSVYDEKARTWTPWAIVDMPAEARFYNSGAGCVQRVDLENGDILLPIYFQAKGDKYYRVTVLRCSFDGKTLKYVSQSNELELASGRGVYEPSLARLKDKYYLTLRNDTAAYISVSDDGQTFGPIKKWTFEDGAELGNYNTQQHWVTHDDALYLVYNRRGAFNDQIIRHRAPLFMAQVDPEKLHVLRETERILVPEGGARLGNFGVTEVNENETWVTVAEWMQTFSPNIVIPKDNAYGADNRVYAARILWSKPNTGWAKK
jgi:lysophospholipase L1-like esterase